MVRRKGSASRNDPGIGYPPGSGYPDPRCRRYGMGRRRSRVAKRPLTGIRTVGFDLRAKTSLSNQRLRRTPASRQRTFGWFSVQIATDPGNHGGVVRGWDREIGGLRVQRLPPRRTCHTSMAIRIRPTARKHPNSSRNAHKAVSATGSTGEDRSSGSAPKPSIPATTCYGPEDRSLSTDRCGGCPRPGTQEFWDDHMLL